MNKPTEQDREKARGLLPASAEFDGSHFVDSIAQALADARDEAEIAAVDAVMRHNAINESLRKAIAKDVRAAIREGSN